MFSSIFIDRPRLAAVIAIVTTIAGLLSLLAIPIAQYPDIVPPQVSVTTSYPGASAAVVQSLSFFAILILASPVLVFLVLGLTVNPFWLGIAPVVAVLIGFGTLFFGLWLGGRVFDRRGPELMAFANRND